MNTTLLQLVAIYNIQLHVSALSVGHHQVVQRTYLLYSMCGNFGKGTRLPRILYNHLLSSLDNLMIAHIRAETCSCILYIASNCNIVVFMTVCIYRYTHTTALCY